MKFSLSESIDFSSIDAEFYQDGQDLYYYDGDKLILIPHNIANKILMGASLSQRDKDSQADAAYDPTDIDDYNNKINSNKANIESARKNQLKLPNSNVNNLSDLSPAERKARQLASQGAKPVYIKNANTFAELENDIYSFLCSKYGKPGTKNVWSINPTKQIDYNFASKRRKHVPKKGKRPLVRVYFDTSQSFYGSQTKHDIEKQVLSNFAVWSEGANPKLEVQTKYFAETVKDHPYSGWSEDDSIPNVIKDIIESAPDNVVIMTDSDSSMPDVVSDISVTVPGAVWIINIDQVAQNLEKYIRSSEQNCTNVYYFKA